MRVILPDETEGGRETETEGVNHHTVMWRGSVVHRRVSFSSTSAGPSWGGIIKWQETHWNLILCIPGVCRAGFLCSSSAPCFHSALHQRRYSPFHQLWTAYRSQAFVPGDPGGDMTFYAHCWFVLVTCYLCLSLLFKPVHNDLARRFTRCVKKETHPRTPFAHYVPIVAVRRLCKLNTPFVRLFCITFKQLYVYDKMWWWTKCKHNKHKFAA